MRTSLLLSLLLLSSSFARAQDASQTTGPDGRIRTRVQGIDIPAIANAPFTAKIVVTWVQPLVGGGTMSREYYTLVARDSQGRVHREARDFIPANSSDEPPLRSFTITDPVSDVRTRCMQDEMICTAAPYSPHTALTPEASDGFSASTGKVTRESLGSQTIGSLTAVGTRETRTTAAGAGGNSELMISHTDFWYSPDLQMYLSVVRTNPQMGQLTFTVTDLVRGEPNHSWFTVPSGYQVSGNRAQ